MVISERKGGGVMKEYERQKSNRRATEKMRRKKNKK